MEIILDMGNVLLEWNKDKILKAVAKTQKAFAKILFFLYNINSIVIKFH